VLHDLEQSLVQLLRAQVLDQKTPDPQMDVWQILRVGQ